MVLALHQGCGGVDAIPLNPYIDLERRAEQALDGTSQLEELPLESLQPQALRIGEYLLIHGRGRIFPAGYARFHFSGNAEVEVSVPRAIGEIRVKVPPGAISGAFGFVISQQSTAFNSGGYLEATGPAPQSFRIASPGIRILGAAEPPGGFANSP
jgi:hypothetical protein